MLLIRHVMDNNRETNTQVNGLPSKELKIIQQQVGTASPRQPRSTPA